ncbi:MAG TPA: MFS transporter [Clostridia bacterium]|nr:MFS transporter [Clostridia bacterium]
MKELLGNKVFRIIMATDFIQQICIWIRNISVLFFIIDMTDADPVAVSLITVFEYLPMFIFAYIGGTLADRWDPKKTMIIGDFLSAISVFSILILISQGLWQAVFAATLVSSVVSQFSVPSSSIIFKKHIDEKYVTQAVSLSQSWQSLFLIVGPVLGTLLYGSIGLSYSLAIIAFMFLVSSIVQFALPSGRKAAEATKTSLFVEMKEGLRYLKSNRGLKVICVLLAVLGLAEGLIQPLTVYLVTDRLGIEKESLQWLYSLSGIGLLAGAIVSASFVNRFKTRTILVTGMIIFAVVTVIEVLSTVVFLTAAMCLLSGAVLAFFQVAINTPLIKTVKAEYIGRVSGLITPVMLGGILIGSGLSGVLMKQLTLIPMFIMSAGIMLVCALIALGYREEDAVQAVLQSEG